MRSVRRSQPLTDPGDGRAGQTIQAARSVERCRSWPVADIERPRPKAPARGRGLGRPNRSLPIGQPWAVNVQATSGGSGSVRAHFHATQSATVWGLQKPSPGDDAAAAVLLADSPRVMRPDRCVASGSRRASHDSPRWRKRVERSTAPHVWATTRRLGTCAPRPGVEWPPCGTDGRSRPDGPAERVCARYRSRQCCCR